MKRAPLFILSILLVPAAGFAQTTWYVPDDYPKIQDAISSPVVQNGDTVIVRPGTYEECLNFLGKAITLRSEKGPTLTDIDSKDSMLNVVSFENGELQDSVLDGFMIVNGLGKLLGPNDWRGGGVYNYKASPTITNCIFRYNWPNDEIYNLGTSNPVVTYSDVINGYDGTGNIKSYPGFVDEVGRDLRITYSSPCHNSGNNNAPYLPDTDVDGDPRVCYDKVDMGADEFDTHLYWMGDSNWTGMARPGGSIKVKLVGHPGSVPVGLFVGSDVLKTPLTTKWGPFHLGSPVTLIGPLGAIPVNGVYVLSGTIPPSPLAPYDMPMQALIGNSFSNLSVLEVREEWPEF